MNEETIGWIISLWVDASQVNLNGRENFPYLSWSPYDRITIHEITKFSDFFTIEETSKWNGAVQRLHLIPMHKCNWKPGKACLIDIPEVKRDPYGIYCVITARFQAQFVTVSDVEKQVCEKISECLEDKNIQWMPFHSLGAEDFVGIFLADTVEELAYARDIFNQITYTDESQKNTLFVSVYSFLGLNNPIYEQEPKADLLVRLHLKTGHTRQEVCKELKEDFQNRFANSSSAFSIREIISGKEYLEIQIPNHVKTLTCFYNDQSGIFNGRSDFYKKYVKSSRTYWYVAQENILDDGDIGIIDVRNVSDNEKTASETPNIHPISRFILKEYERLINSQRCLWWKSILKNQYDVYSAVVKEYTKDGNETELCALNNKVQTVLLHINQATTPIYEIPYHNYYYSGSYNDVLRMYYGVIASIFNIAYQLPRDNETYQYEISYCVDFEAATKVHSSMYTLKNDRRRFVVFHLPYDAFMAFDKTVKLLMHEVFHYVAPYGRSKRNYIYVKIWIVLVFEQYLKYLESKGLSEENSKNIVKYFYEHYGWFCKSVKNQLGNELDEKISNDFTTKSKLNKLRHVPEKICEMLCDTLEQNVGLWLKEVKEYCSFKKVHSHLFDTQHAEVLMENIRRIASATKEAFCDLNMIYILNLPLREYIMLLLDIYVGKSYPDARVHMQFEKLVKSEAIVMGSFEFRIGIVLDLYYSKNLKNAEPEQYSSNFRKDIGEITSESQDENFCLFCAYLIKVYDHYLLKYRKEHQLFKYLFYEERQWFSSFSKNNDMVKKLQNAASKHEIISENVSVISDFIDIEIDQSLLNRNKKKTSTMPFPNIYSNWENERRVICDLGEYVETCCSLIKNWNVTWYRGLCDTFYSLTPSLFRRLDPQLSLYANQARFLKDAYYITMSESTLWTEQTKSTLEHMALLQHYGLPTSLLDFSEDMLIALHFALNPDVPEDLKKVDEYVYQPKVVLFNPYKYRNAVASLHEGMPIEISKNISPFLLDVQDAQISEYCVHDMSDKYLNEHSQTHVKEYKPNPRTNLYPMPLPVRRINARIHAQNGTFLAYNLSACPDTDQTDPKNLYAYLGLERIQEDYLRLLEAHSETTKDNKFIEEVYIYKPAIPTIKEQLRQMNITTAHTYPELFRLFSEYMNKLNL